MLSRRSGFLAPTASLSHPAISALIRLAVALTPMAIELIERWIAQERFRRAQKSGAEASMQRALTVAEAREILGVLPTMEGANSVPFKSGTEARRVADKNFEVLFARCQPDVSAAPEEKSSEKQQSAAAAPVRSDYIAGKLSGAYRLLCNERWDGRR
jgi:hypothetical protein